MLEKIKDLLVRANERGIPIPLARQRGQPSVSLTLLLVSATLVVLGIVGKWSNYLKVDIDQAIYFFIICSGLYFSRSVSGKNLGESVTSTTKEKEKNNE